MKINCNAAINVITSLKDDEVLECQQQGREIILVPIKKAALSWGRKIQSFFGFGPYKLQTITCIFQNFLDIPKVAHKVLSEPAVLTKLNLRIDHYNSKGLRKYFSWLQIARLHKYERPKSEGVLEFEKLKPRLNTYLDATNSSESHKKVLDELLICLRHLPHDYLLNDVIVNMQISSCGHNILHLACDAKHKPLVEKVCKTHGLAESLMQITATTQYSVLELACRGHLDQEIAKLLLAIQNKLLLKELLTRPETMLDIASDSTAASSTVNPHFILTIFESLDEELIEALLHASKSSLIHNLIKQGPSESLQPTMSQSVAAFSAIFKHILTLENDTLIKKFMLAPDTSSNTPVAAACLMPGKKWAVRAILDQAKEPLVSEITNEGIYINDKKHNLTDYLTTKY